MPTFNHLSQSETSFQSSDVASNSSFAVSPRAVSGPPHYVDLHVNAGECVSLQLLDGQEQVLTGPATITMISHQQNPPVPIPVQVPPGHIVHQIADEHGTLKHIILSIMVNEVDSSQLNSTIINLPQYSSPHYNQDVSSYSKPSPSLLAHPKQAGSSGVHNTYSSFHSNYAHRPTTMASIVSSVGNKSKHHHANQPIVMNNPHQSPQIYRLDSNSPHNAMRNSRSDQHLATANHFASGANSNFKFQSGESGTSNKRAQQQVIGPEKTNKYPGGRVISGNQALLGNNNQQHQHNTYHGGGSMPPARPSSKKKSTSSFDHQNHYSQQSNQQHTSKPVHNNLNQSQSTVDPEKENDGFLFNQNQTVANSARNLFINHEQENSPPKHQIIDRTTSISPNIDRQNHRHNQKSLNLAKSGYSAASFDISSPQEPIPSDGSSWLVNEAAIKTKGSKQQSHEAKGLPEYEVSGLDSNSIADEEPSSSRNSRGKQKKSQSKTSHKQASQPTTIAPNPSNENTKLAAKNPRPKPSNESKPNPVQNLDEEKVKTKSQQKKSNKQQHDSNNQQSITPDTPETVPAQRGESHPRRSSIKIPVEESLIENQGSDSKIPEHTTQDREAKSTSDELLSGEAVKESSDLPEHQPSDADIKKLNQENPISKNLKDESSSENPNKVKLTTSRSSQSLKSESPARKKSKSSSQSSSKTSSPKANALLLANRVDAKVVPVLTTDNDDILMITAEQTEESRPTKLSVEMRTSSSENNIRSLDILSSSEAKSTQTTPQKLTAVPANIDSPSTYDEAQSMKHAALLIESQTKKKVEPKKKLSTGKSEFKLNSLPQVRLLNLNCVSITSNSVCLRWSYIPAIAEKFGINYHGLRQHSALHDHFVIESSSQKNLETNTLISPKIVYQGCAMTCRVNQLISEKIYHFRIRRTALVSGGDEEHLGVSEILSVTLPSVQQLQQAASSSRKSHAGLTRTSGNQNDNDTSTFAMDQTSSLINRGNTSSHISNTHHQGIKTSGHQHHHPIKFSSLVKQCRTKLVSAVGSVVRNSLSSYSDTKFAGLLLVLFTVFAMLLAIFIHLYIVAPVNE